SHSASTPQVYVDHNHRLIINGRPTMPIGLYVHMHMGKHKHEILADLDLLKGTAFNCVIEYGSITQNALRRAMKDGVFVIADIKGQKFYKPRYRKRKGLGKSIVATFKDNPAILGWYISDEAPLSEVSRQQK